MRKFLVFAFLAIFAVAAVMAAPQQPKEPTCSPWGGLCHVTNDCCRHLECLGYLAKCIPRGGLVVPGKDTRPIGPGPFPPNYPEFP